ncbi:cell division regulator GpsB [Calidifontibacillus erzurumensis]|uniref:Cell cycle protein GpsB n=1 Tax=Calidifontibacillus erzurumensis TaxID=2741433 RepID=A0A8J8GEZ0_9BACI|nr:cell division regulator GpsB [Calidifontibacillus erzurumensis]NSL52665.1 cell division regulator GpsB [Calidifontibacillus erzurumensis]
MLSDKVKLTAKEILEKDFKTSIKGYNKDEVDQFLDLIIKDYETFHQEIEKLQQENLRLRKQLENIQNKGMEPGATNIGTGNTNYDILKRLSNLEKHVFGRKLFD